MVLNVKYRWLCVLATLLASDIYAMCNTQVDIYRAKQINTKTICDKYGDEISTVLKLVPSLDKLGEKQQKQLNRLIQNITDKVHKSGMYLYVNVGFIIYDDDKPHITIDVVEQQDKHRLEYFLKPPTKSIVVPDKLIEKWREYEKIGMNITLQEKKFLRSKNCPAYHCVFGFDHPKLQRYKQEFAKLVPKNKSELIAALKYDKDEKKRGVAAYLLAHIKDSNELVKILIPAMRDYSSYVRNSVMRVLGATVEKTNIASLHLVKETVTALDFPAVTDRNKALYILKGLAQHPKYVPYIIRGANIKLLENLKMLQPNLHENAYVVLQEISGKKYGKREYLVWEAWCDGFIRATDKISKQKRMTR